MENLTIEQRIRSEIYRAIELLGADRELLATIGSWGDAGRQRDTPLVQRMEYRRSEERKARL